VSFWRFYCVREQFLTDVKDNIIVGMIDVDSSAAEALLGGRERQVKERHEDSFSSGDRSSGWGALTACFGVSKSLANLILCFSGQ
jgi:hypothetical protein